ncbi:MAG: hypothetical protein ACXAAQ_02365 [Candidatus Thorarchaeota archaeon]
MRLNRSGNPSSGIFTIKDDNDLLEELHIDLSKSRIGSVKEEDQVFVLELPIDLTRFSNLQCIEELFFEFGLGDENTIFMPSSLHGLRRLLLEWWTQYPDEISIVLPESFYYPSLEEVTIWISKDKKTVVSFSIVKVLDLHETNY